MATPFSYGGFNFTWSNSGRLQYQFDNDKYAVGTLPVPVTQASIDAQKGNGAVENNPAFLAALNNLDVDGLNAAIANAQTPITNEAPASSGDIAANQQAAPPPSTPAPANNAVAAEPVTAPDPPPNEGAQLSKEELAGLGRANDGPPGEASYAPPATNTTTKYENDGLTSKAPAPVAVGTDVPEILPAKTSSAVNPLNEFASYTYNITLFVLSADDFNSLSTGTARTWNPTQALISSAGRYNGTTATSDTTTVRNPEFLDNFFFTNLSINTIIGLNDTSRSSNAIDLKFSIVEPYGMTLLDRLIATSVGLGGPNYTQQPYLLQIDFFGIDDSGLLTQLTNQRKRIPIKIIDFKIKVGKAGAEYDVSCVPYNHTAMTTYNISSPGSFEVTASTVKEFFDTAADSSSAASLADKNRLETNLTNAQSALESANTSTLRSKPVLVENAAKNVAAAEQALNTANYNIKSFADAWNRWHQDVKIAKIAKVNNEIAFNIDPEIANSKIVDADGKTTSPGQTPMTNDAGKKAEAKVQTGAAKSSNNYQSSKKAFHVAQGDNIVKIIEDVVRQSEYVRSQLINDTETKKLDLPQNKDFNWFKVIPQVELKSFDAGRNEYATKTTYHVKKYTAKNIKHPQVPASGPPKPVKEYNYIYTGLNTDIIDFDIEFNAAYYVTVTMDKNAVQTTSGMPVADATADKGATAGITQHTTDVVVKVIGNDAQGSATFDAGRDAKAQLASSFIKSLYTAAQGDMIAIKLKINGDPTLIKQDDVYSNPGQRDYDSPDGLNPKTGSITMDASQMFCKVNFLTPSDIDTDTGLLIKNAKYTNSTFNGYYQILSVENHFYNGKFEQTLELIRQFDLPAPTADNNRSEAATGVAGPTSTSNSTTVAMPAGITSASFPEEKEDYWYRYATPAAQPEERTNEDAAAKEGQQIANDIKDAPTVAAEADAASSASSSEPAANPPEEL